MNSENLNDINIQFEINQSNINFKIYENDICEFELVSNKDIRISDNILKSACLKRVQKIQKLSSNEYSKKLIIKYIFDLGIVGFNCPNHRMKRMRKNTYCDILTILEQKLIPQMEIATTQNPLTMGVGKFTNHTKAYITQSDIKYGFLVDNTNMFWNTRDNEDYQTFGIEDIGDASEDIGYRNNQNNMSIDEGILLMQNATLVEFYYGNPIENDIDKMSSYGMQRLGYHRCSKCGKHTKSMYVNSNNVCTLCVEDDIKYHIHSYSYKPHPRYFRLHNGIIKGFENPHFHKNIYIGIEIETSIRQKYSKDIKSIVDNIIRSSEYRGKNLFYAKYDGSLGTYGVEFVSHPMTYNAFLSIDWDEIFAKFRSQIRSYSDDRCGIHIHLSRNVMSDFTMTKFMDLMYQNESFTELIAQRDTSEWARIRNSHFVNFKKVTSEMKHLKSDNYDKFIKAQFGDRYSAINFNNTPTIEIRIFKGNLKTDRLKKNVEYLFAMREFCEFASLKDIKVKNFVGFVKSNFKAFPNLNRFLNQFNKSLKSII